MIIWTSNNFDLSGNILSPIAISRFVVEKEMNHTNTLDSIEETSRERKRHKTSTENVNKLKNVMQCDNLKCDDATKSEMFTS